MQLKGIIYSKKRLSRKWRQGELTFLIFVCFLFLPCCCLYFWIASMLLYMFSNCCHIVIIRSHSVDACYRVVFIWSCSGDTCYFGFLYVVVLFYMRPCCLGMLPFYFIWGHVIWVCCHVVWPDAMFSRYVIILFCMMLCCLSLLSCFFYDVMLCVCLAELFVMVIMCVCVFGRAIWDDIRAVGVVDRVVLFCC